MLFAPAQTLQDLFRAKHVEQDEAQVIEGGGVGSHAAFSG
jgi:hypothetical protein